MPSVDPIDYVARYTIERSAWESDDPAMYLMSIGMDFREIDDSDEPVALAGTAHLLRVQTARALEDGASIFDIFDLTGDLHDVWSEIWDEGGDGVRDGLVLQPSGDVLRVHGFGLFAAYRGMGLGRAMARSVLTTWSTGCSCVVLDPRPLQFDAHSKEYDERFRLSSLSTDRETSTRSVQAFWAALGFVPASGRFWIYDPAGRRL